MLLLRRLADLAVVSFWWAFVAVTCGIFAVTFVTWFAVTFILPLVWLVSPDLAKCGFAVVQVVARFMLKLWP